MDVDVSQVAVVRADPQRRLEVAFADAVERPPDGDPRPGEAVGREDAEADHGEKDEHRLHHQRPGDGAAGARRALGEDG